MYDITYSIKYINKNKLFLNLFLEQIKSRIIFLQIINRVILLLLVHFVSQNSITQFI